MTERLKFWRKKCVHKYLPIVEPEPRMLTGIEKHELELAETARQERDAKVSDIYKQIQQLESEIAPQQQKIATLRAQADPYWYWRQMQNAGIGSVSSNALMQYKVFGDLPGRVG